MRLFVAAIVMMMPLVAADKAAAKQQPPATAKTPPKPVEIPQGAVEKEPGTYTYTDAAGKKWIYRKTPFGVAKLEDKGETTAPADKSAEKAKVKATEAGDSVTFERPGPFGVYRWTRKISELDDAERKWLADSRSESRSRAGQD